ncbi:MAG: bifunctional nuclease family protein, partial [Caldilineaceae bacterium]|nr:bifunctional nuclease family protein [Caldilineaceae bacterium]
MALVLVYSYRIASSVREGGNREPSMIEVLIDSVRVSLMSQYRIVVLREEGGVRYLPIWIGPFEADAITIQLQGIEVSRPM